MKTVPLPQIAAVIRSKNAGPYELTLDIMFKREEEYAYLRKLNFFTRELIAGIYGMPPEKIIKITYFDPAWAVKITLVRPVVSGSVGDTDVYGAQQHAPLLGLRVPVSEAG